MTITTRPARAQDAAALAPYRWSGLAAVACGDGRCHGGRVSAIDIAGRRP
ncbi:hypothetical protein [Aeromonas simiae]|nr:hypothetical protein [Aeromonas simiae]